MTEITIRVSDSSQTLKIKHLLYNQTISIDHNDEMLKNIVEEAVKSFKGNAEDIDITIKFRW